MLSCTNFRVQVVIVSQVRKCMGRCPYPGSRPGLGLRVVGLQTKETLIAGHDRGEEQRADAL